MNVKNRYLPGILWLPLQFVFASTAFCQNDVEPKAAEEAVVGIAQFARKAELTFGTAGQIAAMYVQEGETVAAGDVVAKLDDRTARASLKEAIERASSRGALLAAEAQLAAAKSRLAAVEKANLSYHNAFSQQAVADLREAVEVAAESVRQQAEQIEIADASKKTAESQLEALRLAAPFDGTIVRKLKSVGEGVDPVAGVYQLVSDRRIRVEFFVPESQIDSYRRGMAVRMRPATGGGEQSVFGTVGFVDLSIQPVRRVIRVWTEIDRPDWIMEGMRLGIQPIESTLGGGQSQAVIGN